MEDDNRMGENEALLAFVQANCGAHGIDEGKLANEALLALPPSLVLHDLKKYRDARRTAPERRTGTALFSTLESFIAHVLRFKDEHSAIFANDNPKTPALTAVLDYHEKTAAGAPRFGVHRGHYAFPLSEPWQAWASIATKQLTQGDFAQLLEDRINDVLDPANVGESTANLAVSLGITLAGPAALQAIARGLSVRVDSKVVNAINLSTGETQINFEESHRDQGGNALKIPGGFAIAIPVFREGTFYQIAVRLRYRVQGGQIVYRLVPHRTELVFADAFRGSCEIAADKTGLPLFYGQPES
jgi:hypothetical protein